MNERDKPWASINILVIGAGGTGSEVVYALGKMGFKNIDVVDFDIIETVNLDRLFYADTRSVSEYKCEKLAEFYNHYFKDVMIHSVVGQIQDNWKLVDKSNVIFMCVDKVQTRLSVNEYVCKTCRYAKSVKILIDIGVEGEASCCRMYLAGSPDDNLACFECWKEMYNDDTKRFPLCTVSGIPRTKEECVIKALAEVEQEMEEEEHKQNKGEVPTGGRELGTSKGQRESKIVAKAISNIRSHMDGQEVDQKEIETILSSVTDSIIPSCITINSYISSYAVSNLVDYISAISGECEIVDVLKFFSFHFFDGSSGRTTDYLLRRNDHCTVCGAEIENLSVLCVSGKDKLRAFIIQKISEKPTHGCVFANEVCLYRSGEFTIMIELVEIKKGDVIRFIQPEEAPQADGTTTKPNEYLVVE